MMKKIFLNAIAFLMILFPVSLLHADAITDGLKFYKSGNYEKAAICFNKPDAKKDRKVQRNLCYMYLTGSGVKKDELEAMRWFQKSAAQGYAQAQYDIGLMYDNGVGINQDYQEALRWYIKAARE